MLSFLKLVKKNDKLKVCTRKLSLVKLCKTFRWDQKHNSQNIQVNSITLFQPQHLKIYLCEKVFEQSTLNKKTRTETRTKNEKLVTMTLSNTVTWFFNSQWGITFIATTFGNGICTGAMSLLFALSTEWWTFTPSWPRIHTTVHCVKIEMFRITQIRPYGEF